jgi:hypothetical protein
MVNAELSPELSPRFHIEKGHGNKLNSGEKIEYSPDNLYSEQGAIDPDDGRQITERKPTTIIGLSGKPVKGEWHWTGKDFAGKTNTLRPRWVRVEAEGSL